MVLSYKDVTNAWCHELNKKQQQTTTIIIYYPLNSEIKRVKHEHHDERSNFPPLVIMKIATKNNFHQILMHKHEKRYQSSKKMARLESLSLNRVGEKRNFANHIYAERYAMICYEAFICTIRMWVTFSTPFNSCEYLINSGSNPITKN